MVTRKMRVLAASLALVLCVSLYSAPKSKAVATEIAVGTAAVASYFQATGLTMAASAGATGALVTTGVADIAGSYAMATGAASSGSAFLSSLAAGVSISPAGAIVLTAAAVVAIGALVAWYIGENGLEDEGDTVTLLPGTSDTYSYNGVDLSDVESVWTDKETYPYAHIYPISGRTYLECYGEQLTFKDVYLVSFVECGCYRWKLNKSSLTWEYDLKFTAFAGNQAIGSSATIIWNNYDILSVDGSVHYAATVPVPVGDVQNQLDVTRAPDFTQPDTELIEDSPKQMEITFDTPITTLDDFATTVPNLIVEGDFAPTYEITPTETGGDTGTDTEPEEEPAVVPWLERIHTTLTNLGTSIADKIMNGLQSLFVPDEAFFAEAVPALQETFQGRMGLLTFPISLLADFLGRLLDLSDQDPILRWNSVSIYGTELIAAGQYNLNDALKSAPVKQMHDIYMIAVNAILIFAFLGLCHNKYRKIMQN